MPATTRSGAAAVSGKRRVEECRGVAEDVDFVCVYWDRPVCLLALGTNNGLRTFVVAPHLVTMAAALVANRSMTLVRYRSPSPTPVVCSLVEMSMIDGVDHEDGVALPL
jgi:hypothetical protein